MEMNELFYKEPYLKEFSSKVIECNKEKDGYHVVLEDTIFYPEGGGQPGDIGSLNSIKVLDTKRRKDEVIYHLCEEEIPVGTQVSGSIDWDRRFDLMQNHSGEHIVSGIIHNMFGYENVGFHMGEVIQIDISGPLTWQQLMKVETKANEVIYSNIPIEITFPSNEELERIEYRSKKELEGKVRIITIGETDVCACCGMHVKSTGEIGLIKILSVEKHKDGVRVEMLSGKRALEYIQHEHEQVKNISNLLSAKPLEIFEAVNKVNDTNAKLVQEKKQTIEKLLNYKLNEYDEAQKLILDFEEGIDRVSMVNFADKLLKEKNCEVVCVCSKETNGYSYIILSNTIDLKENVKEINEKLNGRGGGKAEVIQGSFSAKKELIEKVLHEMFD